MIRIAISGGGTGGHIYPAIAICKGLLQLDPGVKIIYIGGKGQRESVIVPDFGFDFVPIHVESFPRSLSKRWFKVIFKVPMGFFESMSILRKFSPHLVIGTGGYVCGPVLLGAVILRIPIMIQEQNAIPGITNRLMGRWADEIHVPFGDNVKFFPEDRIKITANPIRPEIASASGGRERMGLSTDRTTITFLGGSQGARSINYAVVDAMNRLTDLALRIQIIHQTGKLDFQTVKEAYDKLPFLAIVQPYFDNIEDVYSATDLVVCRAGAMTLAEITACGLPSVLIPYPFAAGDHQTFNAQALERKGAAVMIRNDELSGELLASTILTLIEDRKKLGAMAEKSISLSKPDSFKDIARAALSIALSHQRPAVKSC